MPSTGSVARGKAGTTFHSTRDIDFSIVTPMTDRIDAYAELIVRVGANVQPGQTVYVAALVEHAPLARAIGRAGYAAGARLVDVRYVDNHLRRSFIENAAEADLSETTPWQMARTEALADGGALIMIAGDPEPELLADLDQARVGKARPVDAANRQLRAQNERAVNWTIAAFPTEGQAKQVFGEPDVERLWEAVAYAVRLNEPDPVAAWREHSARLRARCLELDAAAFDARIIRAALDLVHLGQVEQVFAGTGALGARRARDGCLVRHRVPPSKAAPRTGRMVVEAPRRSQCRRVENAVVASPGNEAQIAAGKTR